MLFLKSNLLTEFLKAIECVFFDIFQNLSLVTKKELIHLYFKRKEIPYDIDKLATMP